MNTPLPSASSPDSGSGGATRTALLDAAEQLFAKRGIDNTSVRQIVAKAKVNLGAVNYHFGSKDRLAFEVFVRRIEPLKRARLARLDVLQAEAGDRPITLEELLDALVRPMVETGPEAVAIQKTFLALVNRAFKEGTPEMKQYAAAKLGEIADRFDPALLASVPGLTREDLRWCMCFLSGSVNDCATLSTAAAQRSDEEDPSEIFIRRIIAFTAAGIRGSVR